MTPDEHLDRLDQRRRYLEARIAAKKSVAWDYTYDSLERDALAWVLSLVGQAVEPVGGTPGGCQHPEDKRVPASNMGEPPAFFCQECKDIVPGQA